MLGRIKQGDTDLGPRPEQEFSPEKPDFLIGDPRDAVLRITQQGWIGIDLCDAQFDHPQQSFVNLLMGSHFTKYSGNAQETSTETKLRARAVGGGHIDRPEIR